MVTGPSGGSRWNGILAVWSIEALDMAAEGQRLNDNFKTDFLYLRLDPSRHDVRFINLEL